MSVYKVKPFLGDGGSSGGGSEIVDALPAQGVEGKTYLLRKVDESKVFKAHAYFNLDEEAFYLVNNYFTIEDLISEILTKLDIDPDDPQIDISSVIGSFTQDYGIITTSEWEETEKSLVVTSIEELPEILQGNPTQVYQDLGEITIDDFKFKQGKALFDEVFIFPFLLNTFTSELTVNNDTYEAKVRRVYYDAKTYELQITEWSINEQGTILEFLTDQIETDPDKVNLFTLTDIGYITLTPEQPTYSYTEYVFDQGVYAEVSAKSEGGSNVIANPTLEGTEPDLTGIQVGETKYKVEGQKLYSGYDIAKAINGKVLNWSKFLAFLENLGIDTTSVIADDINIQSNAIDNSGSVYLLSFMSSSSGANADYELAIASFNNKNTFNTGYVAKTSLSQLNFTFTALDFDIENDGDLDYGLYVWQFYIRGIISIYENSTYRIIPFNIEDFINCLDTVNND